MHARLGISGGEANLQAGHTGVGRASRAAYEILSVILSDSLSLHSMYLQLTGTHVRLLGSMHLFSAASPRMPAWVSQAFDWAETLVFESDAQAILPFLKREGGHPLSMRCRRTCGAGWTLPGLPPAFGAAQRIAAVGCDDGRADALPARGGRRRAEDAQRGRGASEAVPLSGDRRGGGGVARVDSVAGGLRRTRIAARRSDRASAHAGSHAGRMAAARSSGVYEVAAESPMFSLPGIRSAILDARNRAWAPRVREALDSRSGHSWWWARSFVRPGQPDRTPAASRRAHCPSAD